MAEAAPDIAVPTAASTPSGTIESVISAANLLLVAMLKLNRVFIPPLLRWTRSRRAEWIRRSSRDIAAEIRKDPSNRFLCRSSCCRDIQPETIHPRLSSGQFNHLFDLDITSLNAFHDTQRGPPPPPPPATTQPPASTPPAARDEDDEIEPTPSAASVRPAPQHSYKLSDEEAYYRLRVLQEERHRSARFLLFTYTSVMTTVTTSATIFVYSAVLITLVLRFARLDVRTSLIFAFSLIATATISEADFIMRNRSRHNARDAAAGDDTANVRTVIGANPTQRTAQAHGPDAEPQARQVEDFSDCDSVRR